MDKTVLKAQSGLNGAGSDASLGFQLNYDPFNGFSTFEKLSPGYYIGMPDKAFVDKLSLHRFDNSGNNQTSYIESFTYGDTLEIRNNEDYAVYQIQSVDDDATSPYIDIYISSLVSSGGYIAFTSGNQYNFTFDRSNSPEFVYSTDNHLSHNEIYLNYDSIYNEWIISINCSGTSYNLFADNPHHPSHSQALLLCYTTYPIPGSANMAVTDFYITPTGSTWNTMSFNLYHIKHIPSAGFLVSVY